MKNYNKNINNKKKEMIVQIEVGDKICFEAEKIRRELIVKSINGDEIIIENEKGKLIKQDKSWLEGTLNWSDGCGFKIRQGEEFYGEINKSYFHEIDTSFKDGALMLDMSGYNKLRDMTKEEIKVLSNIDFDNLKILETKKTVEEYRHCDDKIITKLMFDSKNYYKITLNSPNPKTEEWQDYSDLGFEPIVKIEKLEKEPKKIETYEF